MDVTCFRWSCCVCVRRCLSVDVCVRLRFAFVLHNSLLCCMSLSRFIVKGPITPRDVPENSLLRCVCVREVVTHMWFSLTTAHFV